VQMAMVSTRQKLTQRKNRVRFPERGMDIAPQKGKSGDGNGQVGVSPQKLNNRNSPLHGQVQDLREVVKKLERFTAFSPLFHQSQQKAE